MILNNKANQKNFLKTSKIYEWKTNSIFTGTMDHYNKCIILTEIKEDLPRVMVLVFEHIKG